MLRMLLLKRVRNWSDEPLEREVRANLVYRSFCRIGVEKGAGRQDSGAPGTGRRRRRDR